MEISGWWLFALLVIVIPFFFWYRVKIINKHKDGVTVRCPLCHKDQRLMQLENYLCINCKQEVRFFDSVGNRLRDLETYRCLACDAENFMGILTCSACGLANQAGIPK